jgi:hypothetical protein
MALTYDDLRIRVAEYLGVSYKGADGTEKPQLPQKAYQLDIVSKIVNDGYERFISEFNWEFMAPLGSITFVSQTTGTIETGGTGTFTDTARTETTGNFNGQNIKISGTDGSSFVTKVLTSTSSGVFTFEDGTLVFTAGETYSISAAVDGENHRYLMPEDFFGSIIREMTYGSVTGTPLFRISQVSEDVIRSARAGGTIDNGDPRIVGFRPIEVDSKPRWEAAFWPAPSTLRTVSYRYRRFPVALSQGTQVPITGQQHDQTLVAVCLAEAELERFSQVGTREDRYQKQLVLSKSLDKESRPKNLGNFGDRSDDILTRFPIGNVDEFDGVDIS